jgi:hypothetical protein
VKQVLVRTIVRALRGRVSLGRRARWIVRTSPPGDWYDWAVKLTRLQWALCRCAWWRPDIARRNAVFLDLLLLELNESGKFPIRWRVEGREHLGGGQNPGDPPILFCSSHLPFFAVHMYFLRELEVPPALVIALEGAIGPNGCYPIPGLQEGVPAVPPGPKSLVRVKRALQNGDSVGSMMDEYAGGPLKPQLLGLVGKVRARPLFLFSELDADGAAKLTIAPLPFPACDSEEAIQANMAAYDRERQRILLSIGKRARGGSSAIQPVEVVHAFGA